MEWDLFGEGVEEGEEEGEGELVAYISEVKLRFKEGIGLPFELERLFDLGERLAKYSSYKYILFPIP